MPRKILSKLINIFNFCLKIFTGETVISLMTGSLNYFSPEHENNYNIEDISAEEICFFGLNVKPVPAFTYSLFHLIGYGIMFYLGIFPRWIELVLNYEMLTVVYIITSYNIYTKIPLILFRPFVKWLFKIYNNFGKKVISP